MARFVSITHAGAAVPTALYAGMPPLELQRALEATFGVRGVVGVTAPSGAFVPLRLLAAGPGPLGGGGPLALALDVGAADRGGHRVLLALRGYSVDELMEMFGEAAAAAAGRGGGEGARGAAIYGHEFRALVFRAAGRRLRDALPAEVAVVDNLFAMLDRSRCGLVDAPTFLAGMTVLGAARTGGGGGAAPAAAAPAADAPAPARGGGSSDDASEGSVEEGDEGEGEGAPAAPMTLRELRWQTGLNHLKPSQVLLALSDELPGSGDFIERSVFERVMLKIVVGLRRASSPSEGMCAAVAAVYRMCDREDAGVVSFAALAAVLTTLCGGSREERIRAAFTLCVFCGAPCRA